MSKLTSKQRNYLIIGLCAIVLLMAVGYAAFATQLNISGTAQTTSKWNILITNVTSKEVVGQASNKAAPSWDSLTATFSTNLVSPGDSITYDVTVENQGNLDAVLNKITLSDSSNPAIIFTTSGLTEGDTLAPGTSATLSVKVEYDSKVTTQPTNLTDSLIVTLDYEQYVGATGSGDTENELTTVYSFNSSRHYYIGTSTITDYVTDYTALSSYTEGIMAFFKHDIDTNNVIQNAYTCMKFTFINEPVCMQGGSTDYYSANQAILTNLQSTFENNGGSCSLSDYRTNCTVGNFDIAADADGYVSATSDFYNPHISTNGYVGVGFVSEPQ